MNTEDTETGNGVFVLANKDDGRQCTAEFPRCLPKNRMLIYHPHTFTAFLIDINGRRGGKFYFSNPLSLLS